jgi:hypothetical protein
LGGVVAGGVLAGVEGVPVVVLGVACPVVVVVVEPAGAVCVAAPEVVAAALVCTTLALANAAKAQVNVMNLVLATGRRVASPAEAGRGGSVKIH